MKVVTLKQTRKKEEKSGYKKEVAATKDTGNRRASEGKYPLGT